MKNQKLLNEQTGSYLRIRFHGDGEKTKELKVPTFWDASIKQWHAVLHLSDGKLIEASADDSVNLQSNFIILLKGIFEGDSKHKDEIWAMLEEK